MSQKDQQPILCSRCGVIISKIEPDMESEYKTPHWGQQMDYWSVEFHWWGKSAQTKYHQPENHRLCVPCKEEITKVLKGE